MVIAAREGVTKIRRFAFAMVKTNHVIRKPLQHKLLVARHDGNPARIAPIAAKESVIRKRSFARNKGAFAHFIIVYIVIVY